MAKRVIRLTFPEELIQEPVTYRLGLEFEVVTSILRASVGDKDAWMVMELDGEKTEISRSLESLQRLGVRVDERPEWDAWKEDEDARFFG